MTAIGESGRFFFWFVIEAGEFLVYYWPISVATLASGVAALTVRSPLRDPRFRGRLRLLAIPYAIPLLILLIGTLLRYELHGPPHPNWREPPAWRFHLLLAPLILYAVLLTGAVVAMKGARLRSAGVLIPGAWLSLCAYFPAGFAVAGVGP
jgi:hypothetical protein